tara:strand:- start:558 stop:827 length:270 start_codon:yes stop_codon:yes gene_type:complete
MISLMELGSNFMDSDRGFWKKWRNSHNYDIGYKGYTVLKGRYVKVTVVDMEYYESSPEKIWRYVVATDWGYKLKRVSLFTKKETIEWSS